VGKAVGDTPACPGSPPKAPAKSGNCRHGMAQFGHYADLGARSHPERTCGNCLFHPTPSKVVCTRVELVSWAIWHSVACELVPPDKVHSQCDPMKMSDEHDQHGDRPHGDTPAIRQFYGNRKVATTVAHLPSDTADNTDVEPASFISNASARLSPRISSQPVCPELSAAINPLSAKALAFVLSRVERHAGSIPFLARFALDSPRVCRLEAAVT
jgi:hypothetical protein